MVSFLFFNGCQQESVITYPVIDGCETSDVYTITVNGKSIWTEKFLTKMDIGKLPDWFTSSEFTNDQQEVHLADFSCDDSMIIEIEITDKINKAFVRPNSRGINAEIQGNKIRFNIPGPDKLYIEIDELPPLCFFANPVEKERPEANNQNVRYYGPGVHHAGMMELKDGEELYIAGGALVYGGIRVKGASDIKVHGRGILDGGFKHQRMVVLEDGAEIEFNGIMIRNGISWTNTVINCNNVKYQGVKVISFGPGGDGINPLGSKQMIINNCFLRCTDDCIAIKSPDSTHVVKDIEISNNTMIGFAFSDGVTIGFETNGPSVSDVVVRNCDVIIARGGSRVDGHSAFSVICDGPARIHNILYEDIRAEDRMFKLFELHITDGTKYDVNPPGHISGIHLKNIKWESERPIILKGFNEDHLVENVVFEGCTIAGQPLTETRTDIFQVGDFVENISFK
ncbi:glycosyl hydrolase family 28 protein [Bacteroidota bacterium]